VSDSGSMAFVVTSDYPGSPGPHMSAAMSWCNCVEFVRGVIRAHARARCSIRYGGRLSAGCIDTDRPLEGHRRAPREAAAGVGLLTRAALPAILAAAWRKGARIAFLIQRYRAARDSLCIGVART
jgi:hypothetical protein